MAESSLASPLSLEAEWTALYGDSIANNDDITTLLTNLAGRSGANGTLHFELPSSPMTLKCGAINFGALNVTKFACLENGAAITIQHTGANNSYYLWAWPDKPLYEFVVGTTTAKDSRDDYLITIVGTWTPSTTGSNSIGYNDEACLIDYYSNSYAASVTATGPLIFRCHTKNARGRGAFKWVYYYAATKYLYPNATFYIGGTHHNAIQFGQPKANIHFENVLSTDPYCRAAGWRGETVAASNDYLPGLTKKGVVPSYADRGYLSEFNCQVNATLWVGKITGRLELAYGHPNAEFSFTGTNNLKNTQVGNSIEDPFEIVLTDLGYSGPECAAWGWEPGVLMGNVWFNSQPWKFDGFGANDPNYPSFWKQSNGNNIYGRSISHFENTGDGDYAQWCGMECGADNSGYGRIASYITYILSGIAGHLRYNCGQQTGYAEYIHHLTYRGDGLQPAMVGGYNTPERNSKLHLSIYDTLEYAQVYNVFIDTLGGDSETPTLTSYRRGCYNTISNVTFNDFGQANQGKLVVQAGDGGGTGNTATNIKFIGSAREIILVQAGGQLDINNLYAPAYSTINVQSGASVRVWNGSSWTTLSAGVHTINPAEEYVVAAGDIPANIPGFIETIQQVSRPVADDSNSGWTSTKIFLYDALDEEPDVDYSDYIFTNIPGSIVILDLDDIINPETFSLHGMQYAGDGNYRVELLQNGSVIATRNNYDISPTKHIEFLTTTETQLIDQSYTNFQVRFTSL